MHYNRGQEQAQRLVEALGSGAKAFGADLVESVACERLMDSVTGHFGWLDVFANNAGIARLVPLDVPTDAWLAAWQETMAVNLGATELLSRRAIRHFRERGGGRIINVASRAAFRGDTPEFIAYAVSKGGVVALTRSIAEAYGKDGIRAFILAPGFVRTNMSRHHPQPWQFSILNQAKSCPTTGVHLSFTGQWLARSCHGCHR